MKTTLSVAQEVGGVFGSAWDDEDNLDLDDEPVSQPFSNICGGVTSLDGFDLDALGRVTFQANPDASTVEPVQDYVYDALYRLTHATGRMHTALADTPFFNDPQSFKQSRHTLLNDQSQIALYGRDYAYDEAGNLTQLSQTGTNPFTREVAVQDGTNRGLMKSAGFEPDPAADWEALGYFDPNGNQKRFDHLAGAAWSYRDNLASVTIIDRGGNDDAEYYVYDASGQRARKVKETFESGETVKRVVDRIYLGGVEVKRVKTVDVATSTETQILSRSDLHVMDDEQRIAIVTHWTQDDLLLEIEDASWLNTLRIRQQLGNHLGSASLELDQTGRIISYEEYYPYGGTSFIAGGSQKEVGLKEYRYTGKERDDTSGFYYYGARYYAPWLGRWMSADPAGPVDGLNLYEYVSGNPVRLVDPEGMEGEDLCVDQCTMEPIEVEAEPIPSGPSDAPEAVRLPETVIEGRVGHEELEDTPEPTPAGEPSAEAAPAAVEVFIPSPEDIERREATIALLRRPSEQARRQVERTTTAAVVGGAPAIGQMTVAVGMLAEEGAAVAGPAIGAAATKAVEVTTAATAKATAMATAAGAAATAALQRIAQPAQRVFQALQGRVMEAVRGGGQAFEISGRLQTIWQNPRLFQGWIKGTQSLSRIGNPLSHKEAQQVLRNAQRLGLRIDLNTAGLRGLERTGQWAGVPHFKIGNVHIPVLPGFTP